MCNLNLLDPNPLFHLDSLNYEREFTSEIWECARRVSFLAYSIPKVVVGALELIKNTAYFLLNTVVYIINTITDLTYRIYKVFTDNLGQFVPEFERINLLGEHRTEGIDSTPFSNETLATFKLSLKSRATEEYLTNEDNQILAYLGDQQCAIWYELGTDEVHIQDRHSQGYPTLVMKISDDGYLISLQLNGVLQESIPMSFHPYMWIAFQQAFAASSKYDQSYGNISVRLVREGLQEIPDFHLNKLAEQIKNLQEMQELKVRFLTFNLENGQGLDAGGLCRDYIDDLWQALVNGRSEFLQFTRNDQETECMPKAGGGIGSDGIPFVLEQEASLFKNMGALMMYCYESERNLLIGRRFQAGLFKAIFSLTAQEVDEEILQFETQLKMAKAIFECRGLENNKVVELLEAWNLNRINWREARDTVEVILMEQVPDINTFDPKNTSHQITVIKALKANLYDYCSSALAPIHQMAKGIKQFHVNRGKSWGEIAWKDFCDRVQGSLDREFIVDRFVIAANVNQEVRKKADWLKQWIRDPQTPNQQIQDFIKFATGSSTMRIDGTIRICEQLNEYTPVPKSHSCFSNIEISPVPASYGNHNDYTKVEFIRSLKELANFGYQMG